MERREFTHSKSKMSMSDTESQTSQMESFYSPIRSDSPLRSDDPEPPPDGSPAKSPAPPKVVDALGKYNSPIRSPALDYHKALASTENLNVQANPQPAVVVVNRAMREELATGVTRLGPLGGGDEYGSEEGGGERRSRAAVAAMRRLRREEALNKAALGFRLCEVILCLISFSVMAADKSRGWSGDSFDRYKEYRYCLSVNVIAFVYSGCQACDLAYYLNSGKHLFLHCLRNHFDFSMDQILAYLLMSASSSAATRVDDWVSNWGKDEFTKMASASIAMSFLAFFAFALSSLISGYNLCNYSIT